MIALRRARIPTVESLFVATFALLGLRLGAERIGDNSMLVHLRTGIDMVAGAGIPRHDAYTFTAHGQAWVVQSWLPSFTYGWAERLGGLGWVALEQGVLLAVAAWLVVRLARTGSALRTLVAGAVAIGVGIGYWSPRPLVFGLVAFALVVTVVERRASPWWLVPVVWVWVNSHGSFPLGLLWLCAVLVGDAIDRRAWPVDHLRYVGAFVAGLILAAANPVGPKLLWFPLTLGSKREIFRSVVEWRSPNFQTRGGFVALVFLACALLILSRARPAWRDVLPVTGFLVLALLSMRNFPLLAVALAPVLGRALVVRSSAAGGAPARVNVAIAAVLAVAFLAFGAAAAAGPGVDTGGYPSGAVRWLERNGYFAGDRRVAEQDVVGCYLDFRFGPVARTFVDDRVDMLPVGVSHDYATLLHGEPGTLRVLDRWHIDAVVWDSNQPLVSILRATGNWHQTYRHDTWVVLVRN